MAQQGTARGSQKLVEALAHKGRNASLEDVKAAVAVPVAHEFKVLRYLINGIPPFELTLDATLEFPLKELGNITNAVATNHGLVNIDILINGIPFPDLATLRFHTPGPAGGR